MSLKASLPGYRDPIVGQGGFASRPVYNFFQAIATTVDALSGASGNVTIPELPISENANVTGRFSVYTQGALKAGIVSVSLMGDVDSPGATQYYGSDATGEKGWHDVADALDSTANITLTVGTDGVTTLDLSAAVLSSLALADSSVQPSDNVSVLTNDAGYVDAAGAASAAPVQSVNGATGDVVIDSLSPGYIDGLQMQWVSGTALTISSGAAYIEGAGKVLVAPSAIAKTGLSLSASTWYHIYLYDNVGTPDVELNTTAPAAPYNGTARSKTGDSSRRYVGSVLTDSAGHLYNFSHSNILVKWLALTSSAPFRVLANASATTRTSFSFSPAMPSTAKVVSIKAQNTSTSGTLLIDVPESGLTGVTGLFSAAPSQALYGDLSAPSQSGIYQYSAAITGTGAYIDVTGYYFGR